MRSAAAWRGFWGGIVAGLGAVAAMYAAAAVLGSQSLPQLLQEPILAAMPGPVFGFLIDSLQHWGKVIEEAGLIAATVVALGLLGAAAGWLAVVRPGWRAGLLAGAAAWVLVMLVALPAAGRGLFGLADGPETLLVWGLVFTLYAFVWEAVGRPPRDEPAVDPGRRRFLVAVPLGISAVSLAVIGGLRVPGWLSSALSPPESGLKGPVPEITPVQDFYVVSKNIQDPTVPAAGWALKVGGLVDRSLRLGLSDLEAIPQVTQVVTMECISNGVGGGLMSTGRFTGIPLRDLVTMASPRPGAGALSFSSRDGYTESIALPTVMRAPEILLALKLDGQPLPDRHGFPARILFPGHYGMRGPKWLDQISVTASEEGGYWEKEGWDHQAVVRTTARIDSPNDGDVLRGTVTIAGVAFAGTRGVQAVEWSADAGHTWQQADAQPPLSPLTWVQWKASWTPPTHGVYRLVARARDGAGDLQTSAQAASFPSGATGYHSIVVVAGP